RAGISPCPRSGSKFRSPSSIAWSAKSCPPGRAAAAHPLLHHPTAIATRIARWRTHHAAAICCEGGNNNVKTRGPIMLTSMIRALAVVVLVGVSATARAQTADLLLLNGKVVTVDDRFSIAEALAVKGERIVAVGTTAEIEALKGPQTRVIDLNRRTVIPG